MTGPQPAALWLTLLLLGAVTVPLSAQGADSLRLHAAGGERVLAGAELAALPRDTMSVRFHEGEVQRYAGIPLPALLQLVGVRSDSLRGRGLALRVVVEAADGYRVVLALSDLDPTLGGRRVLLATTVNGQPLPASEAPYRLLIAGDERPSRWIRQVATIRVLAEP